MKSLEKLLAQIGCEKYPENWKIYYDEITKNPDVFEEIKAEIKEMCKPEFFDELQEDFACFTDEHLAIYKEAAGKIVENNNLVTYIALVLRSFRNQYDRDADLKTLSSVLRPHDVEDLLPYEMANGIALTQMFEETSMRLLMRDIPKDLVNGVMKAMVILVDSYKRRHNGRPGVDLLYWSTFYLDGLIFRIGRFEAQFQCKVSSKASKYAGEPVIGIHIPANEKFTPDIVDASFEEIKKFQKKYFKDEKPIGFHTHTWMINPHLKELLGEESNVVNFANRFEILRMTGEGEAVFDFVFNLPSRDGIDLHDLPENTSLQRKLKEYYLNGNVIRETEGIILF